MSPTSFHCSTPLSEDTAGGTASRQWGVGAGGGVGVGVGVGPWLGLGLGEALVFGVGDGVGVGGGITLNVGIGTDTPPVELCEPPGGTITYRCSPGKT